eukprot:scaffold40914_cov15-Tisochrysis_lutea.AAC.1
MLSMTITRSWRPKKVTVVMVSQESASSWEPHWPQSDGFCNHVGLKRGLLHCLMRLSVTGE